MTTSFTSVHTHHAKHYLAGLGKCWHRDVAAEAPSRLVIPFPIGGCVLAATEDDLSITLSARSHYEIGLLEDLISDYLDRLSAGENLHYHWVRPAEDAERRAQRLNA